MIVRPIRTAQELELLHKLAKADNHILPWPSHIVEQKKDIIGALSIMPMVLVWMDTQKAKVRDSMQVRDYFESVLSNSNRVVCVPCVEKSPYLDLMPKDGYLDVGAAHLMLKGI